MRNQQFLQDTNQNVNPNESLIPNDLLMAGNGIRAQTVAPEVVAEPNIDYSKIEPIKPPRRKSLPSIVKTSQFKEDETAHSSAHLNPKNQETFIIENGIKKRVIEKNNSKNMNEEPGLDDEGVKRRIKIKYDTDETPQLPRKMVIESNYNVNKPTGTTDSKRVSMPSITAHLTPQLASKSRFL